MKPINEWTLRECILAIKHGAPTDNFEGGTAKIQLSPVMIIDVADRIHDLTRWIPVGERMPTEADADRHGYVIIREVENESPNRVYHAMVQWNDIGKPDYFCTVTDWKRIDP